MNFLQAMLRTYNKALEQGIVDAGNDSMKPSILPLYHSNRRSSTGEDIVELTVDDMGCFLHGRFLNKNEFTNFPISENSLVRTSKPFPHPLCDELSYLAEFDSVKAANKDEADKHELYLQELEKLKKYADKSFNNDFLAIYRYINNNTIKKDVVETIKKGRNGVEYELCYGELKWKELVNKKEKQKKMNLEKLFITFAVEHARGIKTISQNKQFHQFYINYVQQQNISKKQEQCDVTGEHMYCIIRHRGVIGNAKLIGISNHVENYIGSQFKEGGQIFHIGYETSQKVHNMLKYLLDNGNYNYYLGGGAYVVSWMTDILSCGGAPLLSSGQSNSAVEESFEPDFGEEIDARPDKAVLEEVNMGMSRSHGIVQYFAGIKDIPKLDNDNRFCVLILEKVNNGRLAVKYFRSFACSDIQQRAENWYNSTQWPKWSAQSKKMFLDAPSINRVVNFLCGAENDKGILTCSKQTDKLRQNTLERLLLCILEGKILPEDMKSRAFYKLQNRNSFKKQWQQALTLGCVIIKKYNWDRSRQILNEKGEIIPMDNRSFAYGRLLAVYDKLENDAMAVKNQLTEDKKASDTRVTNAARFWSAMIHRPLKTAAILESRTKYYQNALAKNRTTTGLKIYYDKIRQDIYNEIAKFETDEIVRQRPANEDFVLGYYYQQQLLYKKKSEQ